MQPQNWLPSIYQEGRLKNILNTFQLLVPSGSCISFKQRAQCSMVRPQQAHPIIGQLDNLIDAPFLEPFVTLGRLTLKNAEILKSLIYYLHTPTN